MRSQTRYSLTRSIPSLFPPQRSHFHRLPLIPVLPPLRSHSHIRPPAAPLSYHHPHHHHRTMSFSNSAAAGAAGSPSSKDPYEAFLEQANSTLGGDPVSSSAVAAEVGVPEKGTTPAVDADHADVPEPLLKVQQNLIYVSDTDSEFEPVRWKVGNLDKDVLDRLSRLNKKVDLSSFVTILESRSRPIGDNEISWMTPAEFDPRGQYKDAIAAVKTALGVSDDATISVFRAEVDQSRVEYYLIGYLEETKEVLGLRTLAVE